MRAVDTGSTVKAASHSSSELLTALLAGATRKGAVLDLSHLLFGSYVVAITDPSAPRMPNGIACRVRIAPGAQVAIGRGALNIGRVEVAPGPPWDPVPHFEPMVFLPPGPEPRAGALGPWFTAADPGYDALLAGYMAGLVLLHGQRNRAEQIAARVAPDQSPLGATLLRHAARGEVPEPVHAVLTARNSAPLVASGPAGIVWLRGLLSAGLPLEPGERLTSTGSAPALRAR